MWRVRCVGIQHKECDFLINLKPDIFIANEVESDKGTWSELYMLIQGSIDLAPMIVLDLANEQLNVYKSFLSYRGLNPNVVIDTVLRDNEDGTKNSFMFFSETLRISGMVSGSINGVAFLPDKKLEDEENRIILENVFSCGVRMDLLHLLAEEINWANAYKIYEILKSKYRDQEAFTEMPELKYFAHTANSPDAIGVVKARHALRKHQAPKKIADLDLAWAGLKYFASKYLKEK